MVLFLCFGKSGKIKWFAVVFCYRDITAIKPAKRRNNRIIAQSSSAGYSKI